MDLGLKDKVALVMAASKGLGRASAQALAAEGARVAICARSDALETTAEAIRVETGAEVLAVRADVTMQKDITSVVEATLAELGQIDILVINAGGPPPGPFLSLKPQDWEAGVQLTFMSAVRVCYAVVPHMVERGTGSIVAIESVSIKQPADNLILSNSIRLAVIGLLKSMANELGPNGIRVNSVNPTFTYTDRIEQLLRNSMAEKGTSMEEEIEQAGASIPLRRFGTVEEFGRTVAWLASPAASFIHGHALMFDGGVTSSPL